MIHFACKKCVKRHSRRDDGAGSLVFCECGQANRVPWPEAGGDAVLLEEADEQPEPRKHTPRRRDPAFCFNHEEEASQITCADCGVGFCERCVVELQGRNLCGPCKNFRLGKLHGKSRMAPMALVALVLGLVGGPFTLCLTMAPLLNQASVAGGVVACVIGLLIPGATIAVSSVALRQIESSVALSGRPLAMIGLTCAIGSVLWALVVMAIFVFHGS